MTVTCKYCCREYEACKENCPRCGWINEDLTAVQEELKCELAALGKLLGVAIAAIPKLSATADQYGLNDIAESFRLLAGATARALNEVWPHVYRDPGDFES